MPYARFNMAEFLTQEEIRAHAAKLQPIINQIFPEIRGFFFVETSDTSALTISVYDDQEAADRALEQRDDYHVDKNSLIYFIMKALWRHTSSTKPKCNFG